MTSSFRSILLRDCHSEICPATNIVPMIRTSSKLLSTSSLPSESGQGRPPAQNTSVHPHQRRSAYHPMPCTIPPSIPVDRCLPSIQRLQPPAVHPESPFSTEVISQDTRTGSNFPAAACGDQYPYFQHPQWFYQPVAHNDSMRMPSSLSRSCLQSSESPVPTYSQEPVYKRCRLGVEARPASLGVGAWEIEALAVAKYKNASAQASNQQVSMADWPTCSWATSGSPLPDSTMQHSRKSAPWEPFASAYPSPPHFLDDNTRRLDFPSPSPRKPSSVLSGSTLTGSPGASRSVPASGVHGSPPVSPTIASTVTELDSRSGSTSPGGQTPTFEEIHDVPQVDLTPRETERKSILERFPMEIFMRIMLHCNWKKQILLRRCNSNMYSMIRLDAIPWEIKTAILLHEENSNPRISPRKVSKIQEDDELEDQDSDAGSCSENEGIPRSKGKKNRKKCASIPPQHQAKGKSRPESLDQFACYSCFKLLPAYYFEGRHLENNSGRAVKGQKKRGINGLSDKKVDTRVEYVQVVSINPSRPPEWLVKDKAQVRATDVETYVAEHMKKGVNCDDLRLHYKDINSGTHCIAPIRGVNPFFTASSSATPPRCETYRPVYQVEGSNATGAGVDSGAYTYEICIPESSARDEDPMGKPHVAPSAWICQPQPSTSDHPSVQSPAPAPRVREIIALRRFCILCGAKYGAYRRDCNRKIISKHTEEGWWVCACRKVRQAGVGRNCPDCGNTVIY